MCKVVACVIISEGVFWIWLTMDFVTNEVPVLRWQTDAGAREILRSEEKT
jgi:hypothetical protein